MGFPEVASVLLSHMRNIAISTSLGFIGQNDMHCTLKACTTNLITCDNGVEQTHFQMILPPSAPSSFLLAVNLERTWNFVELFCSRS